MRPARMSLTSVRQRDMGLTDGGEAMLSSGGGGLNRSAPPAAPAPPTR